MHEDKGRTTRFNVGGGFGMQMLLRDPNQTSNRDDVDLTMRIPVRLGVEDFFAEWFSMELGAQTDFLRFEYANSDFQQVRFGFDTTAFSALLFFYVD